MRIIEEKHLTPADCLLMTIKTVAGSTLFVSGGHGAVAGAGP